MTAIVLAAGVLAIIIGILFIQRALYEAEIPKRERDEAFGFTMWLSGWVIMLAGCVIIASVLLVS